MYRWCVVRSWPSWTSMQLTSVCSWSACTTRCAFACQTPDPLSPTCPTHLEKPKSLYLEIQFLQSIYFMCSPPRQARPGPAVISCTTTASAQVVGPGGVPVGMQSCALSPPQPLDVSAAEAHVLERFRDVLEAWGWRWELPGGGDTTASAADTTSGARLTHAAMVLGVPLNGTELQVSANS